MADKYLLTREQIDEMVSFAAKEGEFAEYFQIGLDHPTLNQMIGTMLEGYNCKIQESDDDDIFEWITTGVLKGWCSEPSCATHDGIPMTDEEADEWEEGHDPCEHVLRLWGD